MSNFKKWWQKFLYYFNELIPFKYLGITTLITGVGITSYFLYTNVYLTENDKINIRNDQLNINPKARYTGSKITYGRFLEYIEMGWVKQVDLYDNSRNAIIQAESPELGYRPQAIRIEIPVGSSQLIQKLKQYDINFDAHPVPRKTIWLTIIMNVIVPLLFFAGLVYLFLMFDDFPADDESSSMNPMNLGKSLARFDPRPKTGVKFADIAGIDEAKAEFQELVSFLKEPDRYTRVGAKIPKGVLLVGPPGTGKTLLAKAIASEANVPFFSVAGSEFVEMFIGVGASRIRDLFGKAAEIAPCIVFIDEIDAVGRERGSGIGGGNDEREQTLNQLLTEMDGFKENKGVIVVGATNRVDTLDAALLRPGRFDRQINVNLPDRIGRTEILKVHARNKPIADNVSLAKLADRTPGFSGADLANLLNEAAILTTRYSKNIITKNEVNEAVDRIIGGIAGTTLEDTKYKRIIAYHEVGHAIVGSLLKEHDNVEKVTIVPRGGRKGLTWFIPSEEQKLLSRIELFAKIITILAGRVTEQLVFGDPEVTTGAANDLQQATAIARQMVTKYGMSKLGPIALEDENNNLTLTGYLNNNPSDSLGNRVDKEVVEILNFCINIARKIIKEHRIIIDYIVDELLDVETLDGEEFREIIEEYTELPIKLN